MINKTEKTKVAEERSDEAVSSYLKTVPAKLRSVVRRAFESNSYKAAVHAKCYDCVGYEDITENVGGCKAYSCPLWKHRPRQG